MGFNDVVSSVCGWMFVGYLITHPKVLLGLVLAVFFIILIIVLMIRSAIKNANITYVENDNSNTRNNTRTTENISNNNFKNNNSNMSEINSSDYNDPNSYIHNNSSGTDNSTRNSTSTNENTSNSTSTSSSSNMSTSNSNSNLSQSGSGNVKLGGASSGNSSERDYSDIADISKNWGMNVDNNALVMVNEKSEEVCPVDLTAITDAKLRLSEGKNLHMTLSNGEEIDMGSPNKSIPFDARKCNTDPKVIAKMVQQQVDFMNALAGGIHISAGTDKEPTVTVGSGNSKQTFRSAQTLLPTPTVEGFTLYM